MSRRIGLACLLALAAALRFTGLEWGLRHRPPLDERFFVSNTVHMLARGNLDHGFYQYPGLFYYVLAPAIAFVKDPAHNPAAYLVARSVVACFSVLTVALAYALGRRFFETEKGPSTATGLFAAALVACSPLEVRIAHEVRPDVVLECVALWGFFVFRRLGREVKGDLAAGVVTGAATAVKFSGALIVAPYVFQRFLAPGPKLRRIVLAGALSLACFALFSPYTLLRGSVSIQGMDDQLRDNYMDRPTDVGFLLTLGVYGRVLVEALGIPATLLIVAALLVGRNEWRRIAAPLVFLVTCLVVYSTASMTQDRFLLPVVAIVAILAGPAVEALAARSRAAAFIVALVVVVPPLLASVDFVHALKRPLTRDVAADWIEGHYAQGQVAMTVNALLGLDPGRFEPLGLGLLTPTTRLEARHADLVVVGPGVEAGMLAGLERVFVAEPESRYSGSRIRVFEVPENMKPRYEHLDLRDLRLSSSSDEADLDKLRDADLGTGWRSGSGSSVGEWIQIDLQEPRVFGRIELVVPQGAEDAPDEIEVYVGRGSPRLSRCAALPGRTGFSQQRPPLSEVLLLPEVRASTVRLVQIAPKAKPWSIAELRVDVYKP